METCFACLLFKPTPSLCESILVKSKTGHRQVDRQIHINAWPDMYWLSLISLDIDKDLLHLSIFKPTPSL